MDASGQLDALPVILIAANPDPIGSFHELIKKKVPAMKLPCVL